MATEKKRGNRETMKPKKPVPKTNAAAPSTKGTVRGCHEDQRARLSGCPTATIGPMVEPGRPRICPVMRKLIDVVLRMSQLPGLQERGLLIDRLTDLEAEGIAGMFHGGRWRQSGRPG